MAKKRFPWGRFWVLVAAVIAIVLAVGFTLEFLDVNLFPSPSDASVDSD